MADTSTPAFTPPMNSITTDSPDIIRVDMAVVDIGNRKSQQGGLMNNNAAGKLRTLKNEM